MRLHASHQKTPVNLSLLHYNGKPNLEIFEKDNNDSSVTKRTHEHRRKDCHCSVLLIRLEPHKLILNKRIYSNINIIGHIEGILGTKEEEALEG